MRRASSPACGCSAVKWTRCSSPTRSIVSDQMKKMIFVVGDDGVVQGRSVTLGPIYEGLRVVTDGVAASDKVIIDGLANPMVRPGTAVSAEAGEIKVATP